MKKLKLLLVHFLDRKISDRILLQATKRDALRAFNRLDHSMLVGDRNGAVKAANVISRLITRVIEQ